MLTEILNLEYMQVKFPYGDFHIYKPKNQKIKYFEMLTEILEYMQATFTHRDFHIYKP